MIIQNFQLKNQYYQTSQKHQEFTTNSLERSLDRIIEDSVISLTQAVELMLKDL